MNFHGTGRTTEQLRITPAGAIYVCPNAHSRDYTKRLAHALGREDLKFETPSFFSNGRWQGLRKPIVVDHAFWYHVSAEVADEARTVLALQLRLPVTPDLHRPV